MSNGQITAVSYIVRETPFSLLPSLSSFTLFERHNLVLVDEGHRGASAGIPPVQYEVVYHPNGNEISVLANSNGNVFEYNKVNNLAF
jgi:hypothetical protein